MNLFYTCNANNLVSTYLYYNWKFKPHLFKTLSKSLLVTYQYIPGYNDLSELKCLIINCFH